MAGLVIAVDGPAGSGKSSVCRLAAKHLRFDYLDTGAGYRTFALFWIRSGRPEASQIIGAFDYQISTNPDSETVLLNGEDVSAEIRSDEVSAAVSEVAKLPIVRELQKLDAWSRISDSTQPGIVVEGRDITTVVAPDARLRLILTASATARMQRRSKQTSNSELQKTVSDRDAKDLKVVDFMNPAPGVELLDTTELNLQQSVSALIKMIESAKP